MDRLLVAVFDSESKAYEGSRILRQLGEQGSLGLHAMAMVARWNEAENPPVGVRPRGGRRPALLIRAKYFDRMVQWDKPKRVLIPVAVGLSSGMAADLNNARIGDEFIDDVTTALVRGRAAVVAEVDERWTAPVDIGLEAVGGTVYRRTLPVKLHERIRAAARDLGDWLRG
ncbi:MAG TPA: hypothetical protein VLV56_17095 [Burkholderiales bacterium]|nr:hypothetical protein [Burkholderiales bacterium]HUP09035.1 hypothetical protein [Caldimonas sp.]